MDKKILIAVAWPYVNGDLHVGHLAGYLIPADIEARFHRLTGNDVLMVSGSDCHGTPITIEADKKNKTPQEIVEYYHKRDVKLFKKYKLSYNLYTKTTTKIHEKVVQDFFLELLHKGFIIKKKERQYYSMEDKKFLPDRYVEGECPLCHSKAQRGDQCEVCGRMLEQGSLVNPYSKLTKNKVSLKETEHYYIDLSKLSKDLENFVDSKSKIWRTWVYNEAKGWINEGLKPRAITRDIDWGIKIPFNRIPDKLKLDSFFEKRIYVWFEAVIGYLTAAKEWSVLASSSYECDKKCETDIIYNFFKGQSTDWRCWWKEKDSYHYYFLGQDNVVFHTILWPGQLIGVGQNYHLPDNVAANKFMNFQGKKFSKSRGWIVDSDFVAEKFGVDAVRYYVSMNLPENKEGNFIWKSFVDDINNELVANLGNFINRTLMFVQKNFDGKVKGSDFLVDKIVKEKICACFQETRELINQVKLVEALRRIMELSSFGNKYFNDSKVWEKVEVESKKLEAKKFIFNVLQIVQSLSILIEPYLPDASANLRDFLGLKPLEPIVHKDNWRFSVLDQITLRDTIRPLFRKISK